MHTYLLYSLFNPLLLFGLKMSSPSVKRVSESFIKPLHPIKESNQIFNLTSWDIAMLSFHYIQKGLLFKKPTSLPQDFIHNLKQSLSIALFHFYPLTGRLVTHKIQDPPSYVIFVDCVNGPGARFIYATLDMTVSDILSPVDVPTIVHSFFDHHKAVNHDGHEMSLLSIQVTELVDGVFLGCSINHAVVDGTCFWNFFNTLSEIFQFQSQSLGKEHVSISHNRWFLEGYGPIINLPFKHHDEFIERFEPEPKLQERFFHISAQSIAKLKAKANSNCNTCTKTMISSFQSLSAFVWRSITRARRLPRDQITSCKLAINNRARMKPPLPVEYFGNAIDLVSAEATAGELLENDLGWAAWKVNQTVTNHNDVAVRERVKEWFKCPVIYRLGVHFDSKCVTMSSSPRFNMYGNEFGMGKPVAVRSGYGNKFDGNVTAYPGSQGGGSVDLEVCLPQQTIKVLEDDQDFINYVSGSNPLY